MRRFMLWYNSYANTQWEDHFKGLHTQKAYTHTDLQVLPPSNSFVICSFIYIYAFGLRIAIRQPMRMRLSWCTHTLIPWMDSHFETS